MKHCFILIAMGMLLTACDREPGDAYRLDLEPLREIPPELITHRQARVIKSPVEKPVAIAYCPDSEGLFVAGLNRIALLHPDRGVAATADLPAPAVAIATDSAGTVYVATAETVLTWCPATAEPPVAWGQIPANVTFCGIAVTEDRVWLADSATGVIRAFSTAGEPLQLIGKKASSADSPHFVLPSRTFDLASGRDNTLWAVNPGVHLLENYRSDGSAIGSWGTTGSAIESFSGCCNPSHIAVFPDGRFATAEKGLKRVKIYDQQGRMTGVVCGPDRLKSPGNALDLATLGNSEVALLDPAGGVIRVFAPKKQAASQ